jgi:hypothetical protein
MCGHIRCIIQAPCCANLLWIDLVYLCYYYDSLGCGPLRGLRLGSIDPNIRHNQGVGLPTLATMHSQPLVFTPGKLGQPVDLST